MQADCCIQLPSCSIPADISADTVLAIQAILSIGSLMTDLKIECAKDFSPALLQAVTSLLPQLTSSGRAMSPKELKVMIASPLTRLFVAKDDGKIVGMISLAVVQMPTGMRAYLEDLVVDAAYRNRGAATALLQAAIDTAKSAGARTLDMTSRASRTGAIRLYERLGFQRRDTNVFRYPFF
jgi:ribosomal protein S18 acetylase RimI-like enzyme